MDPIAQQTVELIFNDYVGREDINVEYKEFTLNLAGLAIDIKHAELYCNNNKFEFNESIIKNINKYLDVYVGKYACGFWNYKHGGSIHFGINDFGIVKGIPYKGELPIREIKEKIIKNIQKYVRVIDNYGIDLSEYIEINISKIKTPDSPETCVTDDYLDYLKKKRDIIQKIDEYSKHIEEWQTEMSFYTQKLVSLIENKQAKKELLKYIESVDPTSVSIEILKNPTFKLRQLTHEEIGELKDINKVGDNPYYWITHWKDLMINKVRDKKPVLNIDTAIYNAPLNILSSISKMIPYWCHFNDDVNLYTISINFIETNIDSPIEYFDFTSKRWCSCVRTMIYDEPACIPY